MSGLALKADGLAKRYSIGAARVRHDTLRDQLVEGVKGLARRRRLGAEEATLWALSDVSFEVGRGEVLGVVGRNGAGKSTLLKILSMITRPTRGRAEIFGRVGSLLEVGTGFHPELSGRENIYLNGAILGMSRREIDRKFDEIVAFAEIERFLETPVKRYSSGMYVRLAFAVAAHLEPDVLVVDEVLAVGDMAFQRKCLGKMKDVTRQGRTVLFVSHNMPAVKSLCTRAILLEAGRVALDGRVEDVVDMYLRAGTEMSATGVVPDDAPRIGTGEVKVRAVRLGDAAGGEVSQLYFGQTFKVTLVCEALADVPDAIFEIGVATPDGTRVTFSSSVDYGGAPARLGVGVHSVEVDFEIDLLPQQYTFEVGVHRSNGLTIDFVQRVLDFSVANVAEREDDHFKWSAVRGYVRPATRWSGPSEVADDGAARPPVVSERP
jgi:lipopolysaccharide transport system ATP-binding protein